MVEEVKDLYREHVNEIIPIWPSLVTVVIIGVFFLVFMIARIFITVDNTKSELAIYQPSTKKSEIMTKQISNIGAQNNVHAAIACGLMSAPPDYEPPKAQPANSKLPNNSDTTAVNRPKKSKF
jgi:hypothetical protein